jgi:hypothetical protein
MEEAVAKWRGDADEVTGEGSVDMVEVEVAAARTCMEEEAVDEKTATTSSTK